MVKYAGYQLSSDCGENSGASIGRMQEGKLSAYSKSNKWTKLSDVFITGDETTYNLCLVNGMCLL